MRYGQYGQVGADGVWRDKNVDAPKGDTLEHSAVKADISIELLAKLREYLKSILHWGEMCLCRVSSKWYCRLMREHEDFIFAKAFSFLGKTHIPLPREAAQFAFERCPELLFTWTEGKLPFGCHAYKKYGQTFWNQWINPNTIQ